MSHRLLSPLVLAIALSATSIEAFASIDIGALCSDKKAVRDVVIHLIEKKDTIVGGVRGTAGIFEVENHGKKPLTLEGSKGREGFEIVYPSILQEYRSEDGSWHDYIYVAGTFANLMDRMEIPPGGTGRFWTSLRDDYPGSAYPPTGENRIVYNHMNKWCMSSEIFMMDKPKK